MSLTGIAPQFLVDDLGAAIVYYRDKLGFGVDFCYDAFSATAPIVSRTSTWTRTSV